MRVKGATSSGSNSKPLRSSRYPNVFANGHASRQRDDSLHAVDNDQLMLVGFLPERDDLREVCAEASEEFEQFESVHFSPVEREF